MNLIRFNRRRMTNSIMTKNAIQFTVSFFVAGVFLLTACSRERASKAPQSDDRSLVLALAVLGENDDGSPKTLPGQLEILTRKGGKWEHRTLEDTNNNVFHKAMAYGTEGLLTIGGSKALV